MAMDDDSRGYVPAAGASATEFGDFVPVGTQPLPEADGPPLRSAGHDAAAGAVAPWMAPLRGLGLATDDTAAGADTRVKPGASMEAPQHPVAGLSTGPQPVAAKATAPGLAPPESSGLSGTARSWDAIAADPAFGKLPAQQRQQAKEDYFKRVVAPALPVQTRTGLSDFGIHLDPYVDTEKDEDQEAAAAARQRMNQAHADFMARQPVQSSWGEYLKNDLPKDAADVLPKLYGYAKLAKGWFGSSPGGNVQARLVQQYLADPGKLSAETRAAVAPLAEAFKQRQAAGEADLAPLRRIAAEEAQRQALEAPGQRLISGTLDSAPDMIAALGGEAVGVPAPVTFSALQGMRGYGDAKVQGLGDDAALAHAGISAAANGLIFPIAEATGGAAGRLTSKLVGDAASGLAGNRVGAAVGERAGNYMQQGTNMAGLGAASGGAEEAYDEYQAGKIDYGKLAARVGDSAAQGFVSGLVPAAAGHAGSAVTAAARAAVRSAAARSAWKDMGGSGQAAGQGQPTSATAGLQPQEGSGAEPDLRGAGPERSPSHAAASDIAQAIPPGEAPLRKPDSDALAPAHKTEQAPRQDTDGKGDQSLRQAGARSAFGDDKLKPDPVPGVGSARQVPDVRPDGTATALPGRAPEAPAVAGDKAVTRQHPAVSDEEHRLGADAAGVGAGELDRDALSAVTHLVSTDPNAAMRLHAEHPNDEAAFVAAVKERIHGNNESEAAQAGAVHAGGTGDRGAAREDAGAGQRAEPGGIAAEVGQPLGRKLAGNPEEAVQERPPPDSDAGPPGGEESADPRAPVKGARSFGQDRTPDAAAEPPDASSVPARRGAESDTGTVGDADNRVQSSNRDGLPIREGDDVGLAAGMSGDGRTSVHDAAMPRWYDDAKGQRFDLCESRDYHERVEKALLDAGHTYPEAHRAATEAEHARMRQMGFDPNAVEAYQQPYIDRAAHRARAEGNTTPDVTAEPYIDSGEQAMRRDAPADPRFVLDRDGKRYDQPVHGKLLDSIETVTARDGDGGYAVMDPHSGKVLSQGVTFDQARMRAERTASKLGRRRLQEKLDAEPPLSQQQLRERYKARYPEAGIGGRVEPPPEPDRPPPDDDSAMKNNAPPSEGRIVSGRPVDQVSNSWIDPNGAARGRLKTIELNTREEFRMASRNPQPDTVYVFEGHSYVTDEHGRGVTTSGILRFDPGHRFREEDREIGRQGREGDIGFHAGADRFGFQGGALNVSPGDAKLNRGTYRRLENKLAAYVRNGHKVQASFVRIFHEGNTSARPDEYRVFFQVDDQPVQYRTFRNQRGG